MEYVILAFIIIILVVIVWYISTANKFNRIIVKIEEADSGIDIALNKRYDVLTKMIDVIKAYTKHENEIIIKTINLRNGMTINEKTKVNDEMNQSLGQIKLVAENYPELKSSDNYKTLQNAIVDVEEHLQASRRMYNSNISIYNQMIATFPDSIVAKSKSMKKKYFFEVEDIKKSDIDIKI